ncbi:DUF72 domain-containing protein [Planctomyces sp. SH-PL62]|uniref:DUF72 domain-containing protein n=1 Tax=Planctomyces sp. SH-PL62 TaxID=1636152 RepID=UPI00078E2ED9|nr:DUF72 domain-containing protein [Planctomyces sp. SH-PL62]AMV36194.1 hypothetical protein VT85_02040 [Planctomyces sp. SH-PL62]
MSVHIGTSGWSYDHWVDVLYPRSASSLERLDAYARVFDTVEVNNTFYRWPKDEVFTSWHDRLPEGFLVSAKASRGLTQFRKLNEPEGWLERMESGLVRLNRKRGVLLFQLPPHFGIDLDRLDRFLGLASGGREVAVEFRHPSWDVEETFAVLESHGAAYCVTSGANLPCVLRATAGFVYVRLHGPDPEHLYAGSYSESDLRWWADRIGDWRGRDVFAYFNNDGYGHAVRNALRLKELVGS